MKKKPLSKRAKARRARLRREPFGRLGLALEDYLATKGWSVLVVGSPRIEQAPDYPGSFNYTFCVRFTGAQKKTPAPPEGTMVNAGEIR